MPFSRLTRTRLTWACCVLVLCCALLAGGGGFSSASASDGNSEYQVKAAFLYNFMKFVDWPADGLSTPGIIYLGILGQDPFEDAFDPAKGKTAKGRRIVVLHFRSIEEVKGCDLLFISASEKGRIPQILRHVRNMRLLTVADQDGFCQAGGIINLLSVKNRVAFEVNLAAATRAKLRISSQLLRLAHNVLE